MTTTSSGADEEEFDLVIPVVKLDFKSHPAVAGATASPVYVSPILCSPDGVPFVDFPQPPDFMEHALFALDPNKAITFATKAIQGLYDISFKGYFVSPAVVGLLVHATSDGQQKGSSTFTIVPGAPSRAIYPGEHSDYIAEFDRAGNYKQVLKLHAGYTFVKVAVLPDDTLLALAYERANAVAQLLLLSSEGQIIRPLELPSQMKDSPQLKLGETGGELNRVRAESSLSWWLFSPTRQRVLLYQAHSKSPVLEVGAGGVVREVPLQAPRGYLLDGVISANDRWIMRYRKESLSDSGQIDTRPEAKNYALYEVDPLDGRLKTQIDVGSGPLFSISCEQDGLITAFSMEGDKIIRKTADLPR